MLKKIKLVVEEIVSVWRLWAFFFSLFGMIGFMIVDSNVSKHSIEHIIYFSLAIVCMVGLFIMLGYYGVYEMYKDDKRKNTRMSFSEALDEMSQRPVIDKDGVMYRKSYYSFIESRDLGKTWNPTQNLTLETMNGIWRRPTKDEVKAIKNNH